jgi:hypothetical protein
MSPLEPLPEFIFSVPECPDDSRYTERPSFSFQRYILFDGTSENTTDCSSSIHSGPSLQKKPSASASNVASGLIIDNAVESKISTAGFFGVASDF